MAAWQRKIKTCLILGRVSNLPTVWSNTLVGFAAAGFATGVQGSLSIPALSTVLSAMFVMSLFYIGGMFLNDAVDAPIDTIERAERPIPRAEASRAGVFFGALLLLLSGLSGIWWLAGNTGSPSFHLAPAFYSAMALVVCIVVYNVWHKTNPLSPLIMGLCRVLVYSTTALLVVDTVKPELVLACVGLLAYLAGLTAIAKQENLDQIKSMWPLGLLLMPVIVWLVAGSWSLLFLLLSLFLLAWVYYAFRLLVVRRAGNVPKAVASMLAGICIVDALALMALLSRGANVFAWSDLLWVVLCLVFFALTLLFQRVVPGT